ncbi:heparan-alpha-glucosaminide N-acetyltransferase [Roseibium algae]|uniref:Heparan-alpha-glucosaminide N-acetyltransferase n=1 Tax=Roseibium algae TaxID=3123038 RepID=A0ABU8TEU7_9HYPH
MKPLRIAGIDALRGIAVVAMASYHLSWDLSWFGHVGWQVNQDPTWRIFAGSIAGTFLFLAGVSLALSHRDGIRWRPFWKREAVLVAAAAGVSLATYFAFGNTFVRFGILHAIAASSLIALPFLRAPALISFAAALFIGSLPLWASHPAFDGQLLLWSGLGEPDFGSVDYVPVAPWTGLTLLGLSITKAFGTDQTLARLAAFGVGRCGRLGNMLVILGKDSLAIYLIHQPLLYGIVWSATAIGLAPERSANIFIRDCTQSCAITFGDEDVCHSSCSCTLSSLQEQGVWKPLVDKPEDPDLRLKLNETYAQCLRATPPATAPSASTD